MKILFLFIIAISLLISLVECFNFDIKMPIYKSVVSKTSINNYFGYSVAQHYFKTNKTYYVLVGAPRASYSSYNISGAIFRCPITFRNDDCIVIDVDFKPDSNSDEFLNAVSGKRAEMGLVQTKGQEFNDQWFGVSISSTGTGQFSACAHRFSLLYNLTISDQFRIYGSCYIFENSFIQQFKAVPCLRYAEKIRPKSDYIYRYCITGTSLDLEEASSFDSQGMSTFLSIGMPGASNFRGLPLLIENGKRREYYTYGNYTDDIICDNYEEQYHVDECSKLRPKDSYLGMSTVLITNNVTKNYLIASGAPRDNFYGAVYIFTMFPEVMKIESKEEYQQYIKGPSRGSYFGFSIAAVDINGDGLKDLIVGAPNFGDSKFDYDRGAIYVYEQYQLNVIDSDATFSYLGKKSGKFGSAIASLGDIDNDGYSDFAVGAPHEVNPTSSSSTGAVYIFRGANDPKNIKLSQIIYAESFLSNFKSINEINYFGSSLSGGLDFDANGYPDLVIGSFKSNHVFILRTYPIINIIANITNLARLQDIDQTSIPCRTNRVCFSLNLCFHLLDNSRNKKVNYSKLPLLKYVLTGDSKQSSKLSRIWFHETKNITYDGSIDLNKTKCDKIDVVLNSNINDYLTPVMFSIEYNFDANQTVKSKPSLNDINSFPIAHEDFNKKDFETKFKRECGDDLECVTKLKLDATFKNLEKNSDGDFVISFREIETVVVLIEVDNTEEPSEPSYGTIVNIKFDDRLDYNKFEIQNETEIKINCNLNTTNKYHLRCFLNRGVGFPFPANKKTVFFVKFSASNLAKNSTNKLVNINVGLQTLSTNLIPETKNNVDLTAKLVIKANIQIYSKHSPEQVFYNDEVIGESAMRSFNDIGPEIEHSFAINNRGPFSVNYFKIKIYWPFELNPISPQNTHGKHLLYLTKKPTKIPNNHPISVVCDDSSYVIDPLKIGEISNNKRFNRDASDYENNYDLNRNYFAYNNHMADRLPKIESSTKTPFIDCHTNTAQCYVITCEFFGELEKDDRLEIKFIARLWNSTLAEDFSRAEKVTIASSAELILNDTISYNKHEHVSRAFTVSYSEIIVTNEESVPIWVYLGATGAGIALFGICVLAFWLLGCFKHKYNKQIEESERLNQ